MKHIGFIGIKNVPTARQVTVIRNFLKNKKENFGAEIIHHGNNIGGDEVVTVIARKLGYYIVAHPGPAGPYDSDIIADETIERYPAMERNKHIVQSTNLLLAVPGREVTLEEILNYKNATRIGTFYGTVRYALNHDTWVYMITPSGFVQYGISLSPDKVEYRLWLNPLKI